MDAPAAQALRHPKSDTAVALAVPCLAYLYFSARYHSMGYMAGGLAVLGFFLAAWKNWPRMLAWRLGPYLLVIACAALPLLGIWQYLQLQDLGDMDHSSYACALWNLRHGSSHYSTMDLDLFGTHANYTCVLWIPWHVLTGALGLKIGKGLCLLAATLVAYRHFRRNGSGASWGALALLLSPPIASQFFFGFHPEFLAAPILLLALLAYREERLGAFLAYGFFLAYTKEVFTLAIGGILLVALIEKRPWKWILWPGILSCAQMAVYWFLILPRFAPKGNGLGTYMPTSIGQVLADWRRPQAFFYAWHILLPFLPLLWALPKRYTLLPIPLMLFYAAFPDPLFLSLWPNYAFPVALLAMGGLFLSRDIAFSGDSRLFLACAVTSLLCYPLWREPFSVPMGHWAQSREVARLQSLIPDSASVMVNGPFTARFAARRNIALFGYLGKDPESFDYVILDTALPYWLTDKARVAAAMDSLGRLPGWSRESRVPGLVAFHHLIRNAHAP